MAFWLFFGVGSDPGAGAFAVGLALDDELVSAVAEAIQSALPQHRFIKDRHPFFHASIGRENGRAADVPFDQAPLRSERAVCELAYMLGSTIDGFLRRPLHRQVRQKSGKADPDPPAQVSRHPLQHTGLTERISLMGSASYRGDA